MENSATPSRRIAIPLVLFVVVSAAAAPLLTAAQGASGLDPDFLRLTVFSTAVGAAVVALVYRFRLPFPPVTRRGLAWPLLGTLIACAVLAAVMLLIARLTHAPWKAADLTRFGALWPLFLLAQVVGAGGEEVAWRGLVQPLFELRLPPLAAMIATGVLFAVGHAFMLPEVGWISFSLFCVSAIGISVALGALTIGRSVGARMAIATGAHFLVNMTTFALFSDGDGTPAYFAASAAAMLLAALVIWPLTMRRAAPAGPATSAAA